MHKKEFQEVAKELANLFEAKNKVYGNGYFQEPSALARYYGGIYRKMYRLHHFMTERPSRQMDAKSAESIDETYMDLAIYSIMEIMFRRIPHAKFRPNIFKEKRK